MYIEIQSKHIELYSAKFLINAHFSGLRYIMFNWPVVSAAFGKTIFLKKGAFDNNHNLQVLQQIYSS